MAKNIKLLLTENVDSLGIVGDVVNVRTGYARNFLLPRNLATTPSDDLIKSLLTKRADAEKQLKELRQVRETTVQKIAGLEIELIRSCNDQGILYGAITQQDVAAALSEKGYSVKAREVRLPGAIKRIDKYDVHVKLDSDLDATVRLLVKPDRDLNQDGGEPAAAASSGGSREDAMARIEAADKARVVGWGAKKESAESKAEKIADSKADKADKADKKPKAKKGDEPKPEAAKPDAPKPEAGEKKPKAEKADKPAKAEKSEKAKK